MKKTTDAEIYKASEAISGLDLLTVLYALLERIKTQPVYRDLRLELKSTIYKIETQDFR